MSVNAASASARSASRSTTTRSWPPTRSERTPSAVSLRYGAVSAPSGNSGACLYGGGTAAGGVLGDFRFGQNPPPGGFWQISSPLEGPPPPPPHATRPPPPAP